MIAAKSLATIKCESLLATSFPLKDDEVLLASEEKIKEAALNGPVIAWGGIDQDQRKVVRISEGTVAKFDWTDMLAEATNMDFVYRNASSVRVPKMLRYFRLDGVMFIIMEFGELVQYVLGVGYGLLFCPCQRSHAFSSCLPRRSTL